VQITALVDGTLDPSNGPFPVGYDAHLRLFASSVIINAGVVARDVAALELGAKWASVALGDVSLDEQERLGAAYNRANAYTDIVQIRTRQRYDAQPALGWNAHIVAARWADRDLLAEGRVAFRRSGTHATEARQRSIGWCNLGNLLDDSGRWLEAYDAYVKALKADPTNGNAAGNAARLIRHVADSRWGYTQHLHGLHDHYLSQAHALRERTVEIAGEHAAQLYDGMTLYGGHSELFHAGQPDDPYQAWVAQHRLALAPALEGLGANEHHWDSAMISSVVTPVETVEAPAIFRMLNLLKADYLVARRLAFNAERMLDEAPYGQHHDDPGRYVNTLDYALYGEPAGMLILAQRSALDTLDKLAVAVNDYLDLGDDPRKVNFREFWTTKKHDQIRPELLSYDTIAFLALAEFALDMAKDGLYVQAQDLRNAGTHRFALVHLGWRDIPQTEALVPLAVEQVVEATRHALSLARSAFLYVVATIDMIEGRKGQGITLPLLLQDQRKPQHVSDETDDERAIHA
jgi:tetratricopeptide (TPR) repeat protein